VCSTCDTIREERAENARLQACVEELETEREEHRQYAQNYKALAERVQSAYDNAALIEKLRQFSLILTEEVIHGTLSLGFGPDWPAKKVQLAIDRLLIADTSSAAAALLAQGEALKALITDVETFLDVADDRYERVRARSNLMNAVRVARAAFAPGEKTK